MPVTPEIERHPLRPFLPENAQLLMLGSFPPPKERWCMDFFYPNPQNDMWRIMGQIFYGDKTYFEEQRDLLKVPRDQVQSTKAGRKVFNREEIASFCETKGIAIFDTAQAVIRLQGNAADEHLVIVEQTDITALLQQIPLCHDICCTGGKAAETLAAILHTATPKVGESIVTDFAGRTIRFWRMPSTSRAYPLSFDKKVAAYQLLFRTSLTQR
jgi:G:T/U-mismatch repair DNA glycosylase